MELVQRPASSSHFQTAGNVFSFCYGSVSNDKNANVFFGAMQKIHNVGVFLNALKERGVSVNDGKAISGLVGDLLGFCFVLNTILASLCFIL